MSDKQGKKKNSLNLKEILQSILLAFIIVVVSQLFVFQLFKIPSPSMEPNLLVGDHVFVSKLSYLTQDPQRGEILVFRYPEDPRNFFIKRVIGLGGETLEVKNNQVYINGNLIEEPYLPAQVYPDFGPVKIPPDQYFMMGDNRDGSYDSRKWGFLDADLIIGKAQVRYWPLLRIGKIH